jgi:hypothetical protein
MSVSAIAVSISADRAYIKALKAVAAQKGITVAELVRIATDATFGDQLEPHLRFFAVNREDKNPQSTLKIPGKESVNAR